MQHHQFLCAKWHISQSMRVSNISDFIVPDSSASGSRGRAHLCHIPWRPAHRPGRTGPWWHCSDSVCHLPSRNRENIHNCCSTISVSCGTHHVYQFVKTSRHNQAQTKSQSTAMEVAGSYSLGGLFQGTLWFWVTWKCLFWTNMHQVDAYSSATSRQCNCCSQLPPSGKLQVKAVLRFRSLHTPDKAGKTELSKWKAIYKLPSAFCLTPRATVPCSPLATFHTWMNAPVNITILLLPISPILWYLSDKTRNRQKISPWYWRADGLILLLTVPTMSFVVHGLRSPCPLFHLWTVLAFRQMLADSVLEIQVSSIHTP